MGMKSAQILSTLLCATISCHVSFAQKGADSTAEDDKILARVFHIPKVVARARKVDSLSGGDRHLSALVYKRPSANSKYYEVKVVEDNGVTFFTYFRFAVSADTMYVRELTN
jgi:hypothetical protein